MERVYQAEQNPLERIKMEIEQIKELKKTTEKYIFQMCTQFETDTRLKISRIGMTEVEPRLPSNERLKPKLTGIELTIEI